MQNDNQLLPAAALPAAGGNVRGFTTSRRRVLAMMLGGLPLRLGAMAADVNAPIRLAISETLVSNVNINDARAAMAIWLKQMEADLNLVIAFSPKVFDTAEEILHNARAGLFDVVALNILEYRQIVDLLDSSQIVAENDPATQYVLLVKKGSGFRQLSDLRGRRLTVLRAPKMCVASAWLSTLLEQGHLGQSEQFFGSVVEDIKPSRVVLPVFFGQADACLTLKQGFDLMGELNPQVARELTPIASSPAMIAAFYTFRRSYHGASRDRFAKLYSSIATGVSGKQLATLFQFQGLTIRDATCLAPALTILEAADRIRREQGSGGRK